MALNTNTNSNSKLEITHCPHRFTTSQNYTSILATAFMVICRRGPFCPIMRMRRMNSLVTRSTNSFWLPLTLYTDGRKIPNFTKQAQVSWMCFIILNDLYMTHNLLGIRRQLKISHLYGTFNFTTQCICMGTGSLLVYRFSWKGAPSTKENGICGSVNCISSSTHSSHQDISLLPHLTCDCMGVSPLLGIIPPWPPPPPIPTPGMPPLTGVW